MRILQTFVPLDLLPSAFLNSFQAEACGQRHAKLNNDLATSNGGGPMDPGSDGRLWQNRVVGGLAAGQLVSLDDSIDWRGRFAFVYYIRMAAGADLPGGATDYNYPSTMAGGALVGTYLGHGGFDAAGAIPAAGFPPVNGPTGGPISYATNLEAFGPSGIWLYVDTSDNSLRIYNDSGAVMVANLWILAASGKTGYP